VLGADPIDPRRLLVWREEQLVHSSSGRVEATTELEWGVTLQRIDNVDIVVESLDAAISNH
jgi:hypothetical protein